MRLFFTGMLLCVTLAAQDIRVQPIRGNLYMLTGDGANITASIGNDGVLLGGCAIEGEWNREVDPEMTKGILKRCAALDPVCTAPRIPPSSCFPTHCNHCQ